MFPLVFLRYLLGLLLGSRAAATSAPWVRWMAICQPRTARAAVCGAFLHDWVSVDYALTESSRMFACRGRGTFEKASQHLRCTFRGLRRLAGLPEPCMVLAPVVSSRDPRLLRAPWRDGLRS